MFTRVELNGKLSTSLNMIGAVIFVSDQQRAVCHGSESILKETCVMELRRTTGELLKWYCFILKVLIISFYGRM